MSSKGIVLRQLLGWFMLEFTILNSSFFFFFTEEANDKYNPRGLPFFFLLNVSYFYWTF